MAGSSKTTTDHDEIRKWAEERGGVPATVKRTESDSEPGVLRIDFPGYSGQDTLEHISWDEFFQKFDEKHLAFLYQDTTSSGEESRFFKLVSRDTAESKTHSKSESKSKDEEKSHKAEAKSHKDKDEDKAKKSESKSHKDDEKSHHKAAAKSSKSKS